LVAHDALSILSPPEEVEAQSVLSQKKGAELIPDRVEGSGFFLETP
jgi:hypothetical protein